MTRPLRKDYRAAILGAFDNKLDVTLKDVTDHLKSVDAYISDNSARRMIHKMIREGLIVEIGKGDKNKAIWTKAVFNKHTMFRGMDEQLISMRKFIHSVASLESKVISPEALSAIKTSILEILASSYPEPYAVRGSNAVPDHEALRRDLSTITTALAKWHLFIRNFLETDIWDDASRERLAKEFQSSYVEEHAAIVNKQY
jgi:hypothetical protein